MPTLPGHSCTPYTPRLTFFLLSPAFALRVACSVPTIPRVSSRWPSLGLGSGDPHPHPTPMTFPAALFSTACVCTYNGKRFHPGDIIYHTTDGTGGCISAHCGANGTIERRVHTCSPTTSVPHTTFSFSTPPIGKADTLGTVKAAPQPGRVSLMERPGSTEVPSLAFRAETPSTGQGLRAEVPRPAPTHCARHP